MDDLISRQAAIDAFKERFISKNGNIIMLSFEGCKNVIEKLPSAQRKRRKGKWLFVEYPDGYYHTACSECGQWAGEDVYLKGKWNFCPNCGARMRQDDPSHPFADSVMMGD